MGTTSKAGRAARAMVRRMQKHSTRRRFTPDERREFVAAYRRSDLTQAGFAAKIGISLAHLRHLICASCVYTTR
jgi:transposase-like protein